MGICPECKKEIEYVVLTRTEFMMYDIYLSNTRRGLDYSNCNTSVDVDKEGWAECPECKKPIVDMEKRGAENKIKRILRG